MKNSLTFLFIFALSTVAFSQTPVNLGVKAGVNIANYGGDIENTDSRSGLHFGIVAELELGDNFSVQPELLYSIQGAKYKDSFSGVPGEITDKLDFILLPVMAKYYIVNGFSLEAGPQFGILLSAKSKAEAGGETAEDDIDTYRNFDMALNGGIGYELPIGIFIQARYSLGVTNIIEDTNDSIDDFVLTNNNIQLSVGYKF